MSSRFETLAAQLPDFEVREGQLQMFQDVLQAYEKQETFLIEAGTGTGKSLAYLIPALLWAIEHKEPTVIATHTIALQEQLIQKDIPFLLETLGEDLKAVLVKGMNNYVCLRKLHDGQVELPESLFNWVKNTQEGSKSELPILPSPELWEQIGAEADTCTHMKCPHYKECFFYKARKEAQDAHLIVANHHLLFADRAVREERENYEDAAVLPVYQRLVIDEAHHCEEVATHYFAKKVSRRAFIHHLGRLFSDRGTGKLPVLYRKICETYPDNTFLTEECALLLPEGKRRVALLVHEAFNALVTYFSARKQDEKLRLKEWHLQERAWLEEIQPVVNFFIQEGRGFLKSVTSLEKRLKDREDPVLMQKCEGILAEITGICGRIEMAFETLHDFIFSPLESDKVRWIESAGQDLYLIKADLDIAPRLAETLFSRLPTVILCSATLATQGNFNFIRKRLGIEKAEERIYPSPFNYAVQSLLSVPSDLPEPSHPSFMKIATQQIWEAITASGGGAFVLFTSYTMLRECESLLAEKLHKGRYTLYCQGDESRSNLLRKFRTGERSVLFGTDSFWEGVDVAGEALRCVIIVKLPFKVPSDPLFQGRSESISLAGGSPFFEYSLPHAIVKFKQGFGRLIRSKEDRGCVICLDSRLIKKGYGKKILSSLPPSPLFAEPAEKTLSILKKFYNPKSFT